MYVDNRSSDYSLFSRLIATRVLSLVRVITDIVVVYELTIIRCANLKENDQRR